MSGHSAHYWTKGEIDALIEHYPEHGPRWDGWDDLLPDRTRRAIIGKAHDLGIKDLNANASRSYGEVPELSAEFAVAALDDETRLRLAIMLKEALG